MEEWYQNTWAPDLALSLKEAPRAQCPCSPGWLCNRWNWQESNHNFKFFPNSNFLSRFILHFSPLYVSPYFSVSSFPLTKPTSLLKAPMKWTSNHHYYHYQCLLSLSFWMSAHVFSSVPGMSSFCPFFSSHVPTQPSRPSQIWLWSLPVPSQNK